VPGVEVQHPKYPLVTGHIDLVLGGCLVVEVKALAKGLVNYIIDDYGMVKFDTFGYATQLCLYTHMTGLDSCFIMKDKSTGLLKIGVLDRAIMVNTLARFDAGMDKLSSIKRYDYKTLLESFTYPVPTPEIAQKRPTGRCYIPLEVRGIFWSSIFYQVLETTIKQTYICARPLDEVQKLLESLHQILHEEKV
jgi:hypothetical protein